MAGFHWWCVLQIQFEADRRAFIITLNSFGTELSKEDRETLFPTCGKLHPEGLRLLAQAEDFEQMKRVAEHYGVREIPWSWLPYAMEVHSQMYTSYLKQFVWWKAVSLSVTLSPKEILPVPNSSWCFSRFLPSKCLWKSPRSGHLSTSCEALDKAGSQRDWGSVLEMWAHAKVM